MHSKDGARIVWTRPTSFPIQNGGCRNFVSFLGSLNKQHVDGSENIIWKCNFAFLQSIFQSHYAWKCVLTILELNWNQRWGHKKTKLNICHHMLTSSTQLQNRSFHVVEWTTTSSKCQKMKKARAKLVKILFFIVKYANLFIFKFVHIQICGGLDAVVVVVA